MGRACLKSVKSGGIAEGAICRESGGVRISVCWIALTGQPSPKDIFQKAEQIPTQRRNLLTIKAFVQRDRRFFAYKKGEHGLGRIPRNMRYWSLKAV